jgi:hypothetical protein
VGFTVGSGEVPGRKGVTRENDEDDDDDDDNNNNNNNNNIELAASRILPVFQLLLSSSTP